MSHSAASLILCVPVKEFRKSLNIAYYTDMTKTWRLSFLTTLYINAFAFFVCLVVFLFLKLLLYPPFELRVLKALTPLRLVIASQRVENYQHL